MANTSTGLSGRMARLRDAFECTDGQLGAILQLSFGSLRKLDQGEELQGWAALPVELCERAFSVGVDADSVRLALLRRNRLEACQMVFELAAQAQRAASVKSKKGADT